jgi:dTDP-4-amino-4,6-dideoxygalactose transaminase
MSTASTTKSLNKDIYVTQPFLPPLDEFLPYLEKIWESKWLTNAGPYHQELESALARYLGVAHLSLFANGTVALVTALQALRITGEVITTPYSFVATAHSLVWNSLTPIFVDIDRGSCNLDPDKIEEAITPKTTAILPVHCYGNPCNVERIQKIADTYGLKVIYDAAHAFGVKYKGESLLNHGDLAVLSFHATKVFTTFEGGAIVCPDSKTKQRIDYLKNFGFADEVTVVAPGINGKMNELQAAFGLLHLKYADRLIERRRQIDSVYRHALADVRGMRMLDYHPAATCNGSYFPIFVDGDFPITRDCLYSALRANDIFARRYFYPLISSFPMYRGASSASSEHLRIAVNLAEQVLCLPIHPDLSEIEQQLVIDTIRRA